MVRLVRMRWPLPFSRQMSCGIMSAADCQCRLAFSSVCTSIASPLALGIPRDRAFSLILVRIAGFCALRDLCALPAESMGFLSLLDYQTRRMPLRLLSTTVVLTRGETELGI